MGSHLEKMGNITVEKMINTFVTLIKIGPHCVHVWLTSYTFNLDKAISMLLIKRNHHEQQMKDSPKIFNSNFQTQAVRSFSERLTDSLCYAFIVLFPLPVM